MIMTWLAEKIGEKYIAVLKWVLLLAIVASPFIYHIYVVGKLEKSIDSSKDQITQLEEENKDFVQKIDEITKINQENQKMIDFVKENYTFLANLEETSKERDAARKKDLALLNAKLEDAKREYGDEKVTPLLSNMLNGIEVKNETK